jgi:hypothetical protein
MRILNNQITNVLCPFSFFSNIILLKQKRKDENYISKIIDYNNHLKIDNDTSMEINRCNLKLYDISPAYQKIPSYTCTNYALNNNKENKTSKKGINDYNIIYDKNYSGIKKRNTSDEERKNYIINIHDIINEKDMRTTLMIKNIPSFITQVELLKKINKNYREAYNFFYLPIDFCKKINAGYAFINFRSAKQIINFFLEFNNKPWQFPNAMNKLCYLSYARIQGFQAISAHFQKSDIMKQVDSKLKPLILV